MKAEGSSKTPEIRQTSPPGAREDYEKSVRKAMIFIRPPHWEQVKGSTSYTLRIISAQPRREIFGPSSSMMMRFPATSTLPPWQGQESNKRAKCRWDLGKVGFPLEMIGQKPDSRLHHVNKSQQSEGRPAKRRCLFNWRLRTWTSSSRLCSRRSTILKPRVLPKKMPERLSSGSMRRG